MTVKNDSLEETMDRAEIIKKLNKEIVKGRHILGVAVGAGISAVNADRGGADFLMVLNSGKYRQMGVSSLAGYLANNNSNVFTLDFAMEEILPRALQIPLIFGLNATDPNINLRTYIQSLKDLGFSGINNYPTIGLFDGNFYDYLEASGVSFDKEVEAIKIARELDMFTVAFVFNKSQAKKMLDAGADLLCIHLGLTKGGGLGAKKVLSLVASRDLINEILQTIDVRNTNLLTAIYGGPIKDERDVHFIYSNTATKGFIGGSTFERIPFEYSIANITNKFKQTDTLDDPILSALNKEFQSPQDYVDFMRTYIETHYSSKVMLKDISNILHVTQPYLSRLFKKEIGMTFQNYLINFRINKFLEIVRENSNLYISEAAQMVGYDNYEQFSKIFKKKMNVSPKHYLHHSPE